MERCSKTPRVTWHTRWRYPIFQSSMTWIARAPLVTAVSSAGVMDLLESSIAATGFPVEHGYINPPGLSWRESEVEMDGLDLASVRRGRDGDANESLTIAHLVGL
jgi:hypothetical protein